MTGQRPPFDGSGARPYGVPDREPDDEYVDEEARFAASLVAGYETGDPPPDFEPDFEIDPVTYDAESSRAHAWQTFKGTLEPGRLADLIVLSDDLLTIPTERILQTKVDLTILGGRVVYERRP